MSTSIWLPGETPRDWQFKDVAENALKLKRGVFAAPRTGKTLSTRRSAQRARNEIPGLADANLLVSCPLAVGPMWVRQLRTDGWNVVPLYRDELVARAFALGVLSGTQQRRTAVVVNEDVAATLEDQLMAIGFEMVVVDESHHMRGVSSYRGATLRKLCEAATWVRLLTGTPAPKHYGNLWGQLVALDRAEWGNSYHRDFKNRYLVYDEEAPHPVLIGTKNEAELQEKLLRFVTLVRREDVFGPDQYEYQVEELDLPADAARSYKRLAEQFVLEDPDISAKHILTRLTRLQQLASGYLPTVNELDEKVNQTMHTVKIDAVLNTIDNITACDEKLVLFHRFVWEGEKYAELCAKRFKDVPQFRIRSKMKIDDRDAANDAFQSTKGAAIMMAQTKSGGIGVDLSEAQYVLRPSQSFAADDEQQAVDRAFKPGTPRIVVDFRMRNTVDAFIAETLQIGHDLERSVMNADRASMVYGKIKRPKQQKVV